MTGAAFAEPESKSGLTNSVSVHNTMNGATRTKAKARVAEAHGPTVAPQNAATAYASCTDCRTVAVAIQVVVVTGSVSDYRPANSAVAVNYKCLRCDTFAYANQVLLNPTNDVELSDTARERIAELQDQIAAVAASTESFPQMSDDLDSLTRQLVDVVQNDITRAGNSSSARDYEHDVQQAA
jgi:putative peptide zinc metalloprotease protein